MDPKKRDLFGCSPIFVTQKNRKNQITPDPHYTHFIASSFSTIKITSHTTKAWGCKFLTSFEQFWTICSIFNYFVYLSQSILVNLDLSWFILVHLGSARFILIYFNLLWPILGYFDLFWAISDKNGLSQAISGYHGLSRAILGIIWV